MTWPPAGENWEGGYRDGQGRRWVHVPNEGWREVNPAPFLKAENSPPALEGRIIHEDDLWMHDDQEPVTLTTATSWDGKTLTVTCDQPWR
ncbi:hypothetical protein [Streptosporangium jomthongense]|uniref:Uncharacterized protein n=1 Tax=Streptosporangium jomthongense TaxID=1193683 RepID=A0ABV8FCP4_9ACTN